ncbi:2-keto-4-pentenoate hydratase [Roseofilum casamattae]|uniref:Hydratase n=1 Tax=Roseofilum casamattae BLCC-M143 TaxID=3022442 RepID=A0ABT7BR99_9CYAN|nr:hypothetical protein [Roseofilum casamattae]MDJ1181719.1 hydratase [Roseofilum casamattae BLCC-M143]
MVEFLGQRWLNRIFTGIAIAAFSIAIEPIPVRASTPPIQIAEEDETDRPSIDDAIAGYLNRTPLGAIATNWSLEQAMEWQTQFVRGLIPHLGPIVGYKAALTNPKAQESFGVSHPLRGTLLQQMLLPTGATVPLNFGTRGVFEADLIVRVSDEDINEATTAQQVLASLDAVIPFIELADLAYDPSIPLNGPALIAINAGARLGVVGEPIPLEATAEWEEKLGKIQVTLSNGEGAVLSEGSSAALLGHPLHVVLWLKEDLQKAGIRLKPGDLLSLGTITPLTPVTREMTIRANYLGLGEVSLQFSGAIR